LSIAEILPWMVAALLSVAIIFSYVRARNRSPDLFVPVDPESVSGAEKQAAAAAVIMLIGSLLLIGSALRILSDSLLQPGEERRLLLLLLFGLGGAMLLAQIVRGRTVPGWLHYALGWAAEKLEVTPLQVLLLLFALPFSLIVYPAAGPEALARYPVIAVGSWLLSIGLAVTGSWRQPAAAGQPSRSELRWLLLLFLLALVARGVAIGRLPATFSGDEGSAALEAVRFMRGEFNNFFTVGWFSFPSYYYGVQSVAVQFLGRTAAAVRIPSVVAGAAAVIATYWLGRQLFDRRSGAFAALYLAASHYHIHISRIALNNVWDSLFAALALGGLWDGWRSNRRASFILSGVALGLGQYFYASIRVLPLLFVIWAGAAFLAQREQFRQRLAGLATTAGVALIAALPLGQFFWDHPNHFSAPLRRVSVLDGWLAAEQARTGLGATAVLAGQAAKAVLGFVSTPLRLLYDPGVPLLLAGAAALFIVGLVWLLSRRDLRTLLLLLPLGAVVLSNTFSQDPPSSQRYILAMPVVAVIVALPLSEMSAWLERIWPAQRRRISTIAWIMIVLVVLIDLRYYFLDVYDNYVLGGLNTETATEIAYFLRAQPDDPDDLQAVYFFGFPRMGYYSLSTIPYLAPQMSGQDVLEPLRAPATWELTETTQFIFLPEREREAEWVRPTYPGGVWQRHYSRRGVHLFTSYSVER
jgi:4-amino-4-deoxy-L-arabinose transferase-like glycosyltransferase